MNTIKYQQIAVLEYEDMCVFQYKLAKQSQVIDLPPNRHSTHLVGKDLSGNVLWIYNPIDPNTKQIYNIGYIYKYNSADGLELINILTSIIEYKFDYIISINRKTGVFHDAFFSK